MITNWDAVFCTTSLVNQNVSFVIATENTTTTCKRATVNKTVLSPLHDNKMAFENARVNKTSTTFESATVNKAATKNKKANWWFVDVVVVNDVWLFMSYVLACWSLPHDWLRLTCTGPDPINKISRVKSWSGKYWSANQNASKNYAKTSL